MDQAYCVVCENFGHVVGHCPYLPRVKDLLQQRGQSNDSYQEQPFPPYLYHNEMAPPPYYYLEPTNQYSDQWSNVDPYSCEPPPMSCYDAVAPLDSYYSEPPMGFHDHHYPVESYEYTPPHPNTLEDTLTQFMQSQQAINEDLCAQISMINSSIEDLLTPSSELSQPTDPLEEPCFYSEEVECRELPHRGIIILSLWTKHQWVNFPILIILFLSLHPMIL